MNKRLNDYISTLVAECKWARNTEEEQDCNKVIERLIDINNRFSVSALKHYSETIQAKIDAASSNNTYQFYREIKYKLISILDKKDK